MIIEAKPKRENVEKKTHFIFFGRLSMGSHTGQTFDWTLDTSGIGHWAWGGALDTVQKKI